MQIICYSSLAKNLSHFSNFPANMFLFGVRKNICTVPFLDAQKLHSWNTWKPNVCMFLCISVRKFLFQRYNKVFSGAGVGWGRLNDFIKAARCLGLAKSFTIFQFNSNFWKFFSILILLSIKTSTSTRTLNLSRQFGL